MASTSKELLDCTGQKPSLIESLLLSKNDSLPLDARQRKHQVGEITGRKPLTTQVPTSQVLGRVKDFLGVMAKANKKLEQDTQDNSHSKYDIEVLDGSEQEHIEMDLLLGITDLHTAEAVAVAENTMAGFQTSKSFHDSSSNDSNSDSEYGSQDGDDDDDGDNDTTLCDEEDKIQKSNAKESATKNSPNKRPKIIVLN